MSRVTVEEDRSGPPGCALIRVRGAGPAQSTPRFQLRRPGWPEPMLGTAGWQVAEALLNPASAIADGEDLVLSVGPEVCSHVDGGVYEIAMPAVGVDEIVSWPEIAAPHAGRAGIFADPKERTSKAGTASKPATGDPLEVSRGSGTGQLGKDDRSKTDNKPGKEGPEDGKPEADGLPKRRTLVWVLVALGLLVVIGSAAMALHLFRRPPEQAEAAPPATRPAGELSLDDMSVRDVIARGNPDEMFAQAQRRMASRPGDALLLLEVAGDDRHHGPALAMLARLYDPNKSRQGGIGADARQAARYYREAIQAGQSSVAEAREALQAILIRSKDAHDLAATLILQDFWP